MDFKEYQEAQQSTAIYSNPMYPFGSLAEEAGELGFTLEEVAQANIDKLAGRVQRGTLDGSGDNR